MSVEVIKILFVSGKTIICSHQSNGSAKQRQLDLEKIDMTRLEEKFFFKSWDEHLMLVKD